jgi:hypothetical protein
MVVPYPVTADLSDFGLIDISTNTMKSFISSIENYCVDESKLTYGVNYKSLGNIDKHIVVHKIGNYNISVAKNKKELLNNINWGIFDKPRDFEQRCKVFDDKNVYPFKCYYVVAQAIYNIHNDGFGVIYKNNGLSYFPTAHEYEPYGNEYEVICYNLSTSNSYFDVNLSNFDNKDFMLNQKFNYAPNFNSDFHGNKKISYNHFRDKTYNKINDICDKIQNYRVKFLNNTIGTIKIPRINFATKIEISGIFNNSNILFHNNDKNNINSGVFTTYHQNINSEKINNATNNDKYNDESNFCSIM